MVTEFRVLTAGRLQALPPQVVADLRGMLLPWMAELAHQAHAVHPMPWLQELPRYGLVVNVCGTRWRPDRPAEICYQVARDSDPSRPAVTLNGAREERVLCAWSAPWLPLPREHDLRRWAEIDQANGFPMRWAGIPLGPAERAKARMEARAKGEHGPGLVPRQSRLYGTGPTRQADEGPAGA